MDTDEFIMCSRRFINRRGDVKGLRCDNSSNFVGSERELKKSLQEWNQGQIERELIKRGCKWIFQPPTASSMYGSYGSKCKVSLKVHFGGENYDRRDSKNAPSQRTRTIRTIGNR